MKTTTLLLTTVLLLAACTADTPPTQTPDVTASPEPPTPAPATPEPATPVPATPPVESPPLPTAPPVGTLPPIEGVVPEELVQLIIDEAAVLADVELEDVELVRAQAATWSDTSLGCPEDDQVYAQVLTDGFWVVVRAGDQEWDFRIPFNGPPRLCPEGQGQPPIEGLPD